VPPRVREQISAVVGPPPPPSASAAVKRRYHNSIERERTHRVKNAIQTMKELLNCPEKSGR
jgi:hypothetical protein